MDVDANPAVMPELSPSGSVTVLSINDIDFLYILSVMIMTYINFFSCREENSVFQPSSDWNIQSRDIPAGGLNFQIVSLPVHNRIS